MQRSTVIHAAVMLTEKMDSTLCSVDCMSPGLWAVIFHLCFTGMVGYGMAKAAVHQLCQSLAAKNSGMPPGAAAVAILP